MCGKPDEKKPMTFKGEDYCSEQHRKVLVGEFGSNLTQLESSGILTRDEVVKLWGVNLTGKKPVKTVVVTPEKIPQLAKAAGWSEHDLRAHYDQAVGRKMEPRISVPVDYVS